MTEELGGYLGNPLLKKAGEVVEWTPELLQEYINCANDPIYFAEKYIKIVHVDKGAITIPLRDYQKEIIESIHNNRKVIVNSSRQSGKCCSETTLVKVRNKKNGNVEHIPIGTLFNKVKK